MEDAVATSGPPEAFPHQTASAPVLVRHWGSFGVSQDLPASEVIRAGVAMFVWTMAERDARFPVFRDTPVVGDEGIALLPLHWGALVLGFEHVQPFDADDRAALIALAALVDRAVARAR